MPVSSRRDLSTEPQGVIMRFHAGLENVKDLLRDLEQAAQLVLYNRPGVALAAPAFLRLEA